MDDFEDEAGWKTQTSKKRRHGSNSSEDTIITQPGYNLTVIVKPTDPTTIITNMNPLVLKQKLDSVAPDGVIQIRPNYRLHLLAIDARNVESTKALLQLKNLGTVQVQTYEPPPPSASAVLFEEHLQTSKTLISWQPCEKNPHLDQALSLLVLQKLPPKKALQEVWPGQPESTVSHLLILNQYLKQHLSPKASEVRLQPLFLGDFNAHNKTWWDKKTTPRGRLLEDVASAPGLHCLNDGVATFVRPGVEGTWRMARVLAGHAVPRSPVLGFAIAQNITVAQAVEFLADEFTSVPVSPQVYTVHSITTNTLPTTPVASDVDFTLKELPHALRHTARKRTAPGPDGITF
ncbi:hypothetical protein HPB47_005935 [Ixodes persulcatus]|uniref:Uncharacterized protein n=1 Tax=Ixodes persulcatus TaxID=34615 RepID=A0AC60PBL6_IXOPE|nr:hypothetical protein HPB47_005935 [Ixodes persulcatus]